MLQPLLMGPVRPDGVLEEEDVAASMAGRMFRTGQPLVAAHDPGVKMWVPLVERAERTGVVRGQGVKGRFGASSRRVRPPSGGPHVGTHV